MNRFLIFAAMAMLPGWMVLAHGVHDSGNAKPQKGGVLKSLETIHLEFVKIDDEIRIYIYDKNNKPKPLKTKDYPVSAKAILPRAKGEQNILLKDEGDHWVGRYNAKGIHRYDFQLSIEQGGHKDKVLFTVEP